MTQDAEANQKPSRFDPAWSDIQARPMGKLTRGENLWEVILETAQDPEVGGIRGRIHYISGNTHRLSAWIFLEWDERDIDTRFSEFAASAQQLWELLDSLQAE
jgi:hypothetical protein